MGGSLIDTSGLVAVRRGHTPNCSATGAVVGAALLSVVAAAAVVNAFADRFSRWRQKPEEGAKIRPETFGAFLMLPGSAALLLVDPNAAAAAEGLGAERIGVDVHPVGALSAPIEAHVAVTGRCPVKCTTCYLDAGPDGPPTEPEALDADLQRLAALGVFEIALGGGEVVREEDLIGTADRIRALGMVPNRTTSGFGITDRVARRMAGRFGQVNVSVDGLGADYAAVRGWDGAAVGLRAIDRLVAAGVRVGVNTVLTRENVDGLEEMGRELARRGVSEWQWLRLKPAGRGRDTYAARRLTDDDHDRLWPRTLAIEAETGLAMRWDCAMVPFLASHGVPLETLRTLAVTGCPGGQSLLARTVDGQWAPCSFAHDHAIAGNVGDVWRDGDTLAVWRDRAATPPEPCGSCTYRAVCRGGCRIVAAHLTGDAMAPDPECPRVRV